MIFSNAGNGRIDSLGSPVRNWTANHRPRDHGAFPMCDSVLEIWIKSQLKAMRHRASERSNRVQRPGMVSVGPFHSFKAILGVP